MLPEITHVIVSLIASPPGGRRTITVREAVEAALAERPSGYGLTTEYALRRYRSLRRGSFRPASAENAALWAELSAKVEERMRRHPGEDDFQALEHILSYDAPGRYYLTADYAEKLFYRRRRERRRELRRNLPRLPQPGAGRPGRRSRSRPGAAAVTPAAES